MPPLALFADPRWQMALGERAAIHGLLAALRPGLAIELGTAEGGSLDVIAAHSGEVHSFDLEPQAAVVPPNVELHVGDSHRLLPLFLEELASAGRNVDFVLVDGDHSADGVNRDLSDLLASPAVGRTVIVLHDAANEAVRGGIRAVDFRSFPKIAYVDLGFVELPRAGGAMTEHWGGLGLVVVDPDGELMAAAAADRPVIRDAQEALSPLRRATTPVRETRRRARRLAGRLLRPRGR